MRRAGIQVTPQQVTADSAAVHAVVGEIAPYRAPAPKTTSRGSLRRRSLANPRDRSSRTWVAPRTAEQTAALAAELATLAPPTISGSRVDSCYCGFADVFGTSELNERSK